MSKKLFIVLVLFISSQLSAQKVVNLGIHAGVNVNTLSTNIPDYFSDANSGFRGGIFARFNIKRFHIQPEADFSMVGSDGTFGDDPSRYYSAKISCLQFPLLFGYKIIDFKLINIRLQAGGYFQWNINKSFKISDSMFPQNDTTVTSAGGADYNGGIIAGAGVDVWRFTLDFRYMYGFANIYGSNVVFNNPAANFKTGTFAVTFGYKFF